MKFTLSWLREHLDTDDLAQFLCRAQGAHQVARDDRGGREIGQQASRLTRLLHADLVEWAISVALEAILLVPRRLAMSPEDDPSTHGYSVTGSGSTGSSTVGQSFQSRSRA